MITSNSVNMELKITRLTASYIWSWSGPVMTSLENSVLSKCDIQIIDLDTSHSTGKKKNSDSQFFETSLNGYRLRKIARSVNGSIFFGSALNGDFHLQRLILRMMVVLESFLKSLNRKAQNRPD